MPTNFSKTFSFHNPYFTWSLFFLLLIVLTQIIPFNGLYGQDSHEYFRFSQRIREFILHGIPQGDFFYPVAYPFTGALLSFVLTDLVAMQLLSLISLFFCGWCLFCILKREYHGNENVQYAYVSIALLLSPYLLRGGLVVMSDVPAMCLISAALLQMYNYRKGGKLKSILLFGLFLGLAITTRYVAIAILLLPLIVVIHTLLQKKKLNHLIMLVITGFVALFPQLWIKGLATEGVFEHPLLQHWSLGNMFASEFDTVEGHLDYMLPNLFYPLYTFVHPGFLFLGLPLLFFVKKQDILRPFNLLVGGIFLVYVIFLAGVPFQNMRFLILAFPLVILLLFPAFKRVSFKISNYSSRWRNIALIVFILIQTVLAIRALYPYWKMNTLERSIAYEFKDIRDAKLYTFWMDVPLKTYGIDIPMENLRHGSIEDARKGDYVLFNEEKFAKQWKGKPPMENWVVLNRRFELIERQTFDENWKLYELR